MIARPSLLGGDRPALGQPARRGEGLALSLSKALGTLIPARLRPIDARIVARALQTALEQTSGGVRVVESAELQRLGS